MSDYIERDKVINILDLIDVDIIPYADTRECVQIAIDHIRKELEELPSADAVSREDYEVMQFCFEQMKSLADKLAHNARPKGEWIDKGRNLWECSNCKMMIYSESEQDRSEFHKWCSRCGADMREVRDE